MRTENILIGTVDEISEHLENKHSSIKNVGNKKSLKDQLTAILEENALIENVAMGMVFYFGKNNEYDSDGEIATITTSLEKVNVWVISDAENERRNKVIENSKKS